MVQAHKKCTDELSAYVMRHSHGYFVNRFAGSLLSKVNNVSGAIDQVIPDVMWTHLTALVSFVVTFIFMLLIDVNIALTFIGLLLVLFILNSRLAPKKMEYSLALASSRTRFRSQLVDVFSNIQAVRQFSRSREEGTYLKDFSTDVRDSSNKSWTWTEPGSPAVLSLEKEGNYELTWAIREKPYADRRRTSIASLLQAPPLPSQGPFGLKEVRFSPSGKTILVHETARDRGRFQTLIFQEDALTGAWKSRKIDLAGEANTKMRKLDDKTKVPAIIAGPQPPTILRLDDKLVIYEVNGKTRSEML
jgi:hypothetical protein